MGAIDRINAALNSRWNWFRSCWLMRSDFQWLLAEMKHHQDESHLRKLEVDQLKELLKKVTQEQQIARDGNRALLRFIHGRHRLNMRLDPDSIASALRASDERKNEKKP